MKVKRLQSVLLTALCTVFVLCLLAAPSHAASLAKITKLKASANDTTITLTWGKKSGITAYQVFQYDKSTKKWVKKATSTTNKTTLKKLSPATLYTYKVRSYKKTSSGYIYSPYSEKLTVKTTLTKPKTPKATATNNSVTIKWSAVKKAQGYQVEFYDYTKKAWVRKKTVTSTSATITSLASVKSYKFRIRAYNKTEKTVYSPYSETVYFTTTPNAVKKLKIDKVSENKITLSWDKVSKATGYYIYVNEHTKDCKGTSYKQSKNTKNTSITLTLKSCTYYRFRVVPYYKSSSGTNICGKYTRSDLAVTKPTKIKSFKASSITNKTATLSWSAQSTATGYKLYRRGPSETSNTLIATLAATKSSYKLTGLKPASTYKFYIKAYHTLKDSKTNNSATVNISLTTDDEKVDTVKITTYKSTLTIGSSSTFKAQVTPSYAADKTITWSSSNKAVATVSSKGVVKAISVGTANITAKSKSSGISAKVKLTVTPVKSTKLTLPSQCNIYIGEPYTLSPTFTPSNTTNKSFTVSGKDYTYTYKGLLGITTKTDTCKFSDYITIDSSGRLCANKLTVEPETGKAFSFTVTVKAKDTSITTTTKVSVIKRAITVSYNGNDIPWYYGNSAKLTVTLSDNADFSKDEIIWQSSNTKIAKVSSDGTVSCVGTGFVRITACSPDKKHSNYIEFYVGSTVNVSKTYFENCKVGSTYKIQASLLPSGSTAEILYTVTDPDIVKTDNKGNVKFLKNGTAYVVVTTTDSNNLTYVMFTSESWQSPSTDKENLFSIAKSQLNSIKTEMPGLLRKDKSIFTDFVLSDKNSQLTSADLEEIFNQFAASKSRYLSAVNSSTADANTISAYRSFMPVSGLPVSVVDGLNTSHLKSIELIDNGSYTYDIKLVLKTESMPNVSSASVYTNHGKIFDILSSEYINNITSSLSQSSMSVSFSNFAQNYHDSSVTVTVNKATGLIEKAVYDMNISIAISDLDMSMSFISMFNSDLSFDVNNIVEIEVRR